MYAFTKPEAQSSALLPQKCDLNLCYKYIEVYQNKCTNELKVEE